MKNSKILVIAAHPDDEVLGCGATIAKLSKKNSNIRVIFLSDGETSRLKPENNKNKTLIKNRENQAKKQQKY